MKQKPLTSQRPGSSNRVRQTREVVHRTPVSQLLASRLHRLPHPTQALQAPLITPHAIRALQQRRAAVQTPVQGRRRSGRPYRETPRDTLRELSKILSISTNSIATTSQSVYSPGLAAARSERPFSVDEDDKPRPRLSMPIHEFEEDDDDSFRGPRARLSILSEEYPDVERSLEKLRRAFSEQPLSRLSGEALGSILSNDHIIEIGEPEVFATYDQNTNSDDISYQGERGYVEDIAGEASVLGANTEDLRQMTGLIPSGRFNPPNDVEIPSILYDDARKSFAFHMPENSDRSGYVSKINLSSSTRTGEYSKSNMDGGLIFPPSRNEASFAPNRKTRVRKMSRHGTTYPRVPESVVNKLSTSLVRSVATHNIEIKKDTLSAIVKASDWFLEQVGTDLGAYAKHAGRRTVDETDVTASSDFSNHTLLLGTTMSSE
ncbi:hypothetical protein MMC27_008713 [Xylographa pallens]|nr:hypothetical protein [Xylographa pallens]